MSLDLTAWIGRHETRTERLDPARAAALGTMLGRAPGAGERADLPPLFHWLYFWEPKAPDQTGPDGHAKLGGFLPPVPLPRRMWAGGSIEFLGPLRPGAEARKVSTIADIQEKSGRTGRLIFVTLDHQIFGLDGLAIRERQDLVYREPADQTQPAAPQPAAADPEPSAWRETVHAGPVLLFRYSALTLNSHRIHYDRTWAEQEGYPGLVVHGPLQATLMALMAQRELAQPLTRFDFRGLSAPIDLDPITVCGRPDETGADLWVEQNGRRTMTGRAVAGG